MVKTDAALAQSMEILQLNTISSSSYTAADVITMQYQSQNRLDFPTLARQCYRYGISDGEAASFASAVLQDVGIVHEGRGGLVVRSRLWGRSAPGSKPDSTEDPPCMGPAAC
ncbi:hypothetical protein AVEN_200205-1 [Araneus ventricosus]|uniref:Uncharacterized protein n=1 Tax=Araneus ventricosus TaxID=182803 RepID=A0A4Y2PAB6_ARAVE|nr:hypothetical protein AVEN_200205-1 [Araneus ventricosus]